MNLGLKSKPVPCKFGEGLMILIKKNEIYMKGILLQYQDKSKIGRDDGYSDCEGPLGKIIGNPEEGSDMNKENIQIFEPVLLVRI